MSQPSRLRSIWIDEKGLEEVRQRMAELKKPEGLNKRGKSCWTEPHLADQAYVSLSTVKRFLRGKCDEDYAMAILKALAFEPLIFLANHDQNRRIRIHKPQQATEIDWQKVCSEMAQDQLDEQRFRVRATEKGFEVCVFIRLGLVERKQQQRRDGNVPLEQVYQLEQEVITKTYEHDEFLQKVIGQSSARQNPHVVIVGEPGAGKTTQLGAIATYVQQKTDRSPICISLGSLQGKSLKNYLLEEWLPEALSLVYPDLDLETQHEKSLQMWLRRGGVWLLLDGADEMAHDTRPLQTIQSELTNWLGKVRVVLTCRLNVWDIQVKNPLTGFDTYKTQEFRADQVNQFIEKWFAAAGEPQQSQTLQSKLQEPNRSRIRELVKNPLRLALLCQVFYIDKNAELPETKAGLYEKFVRYFYEWKPSQQFPNLILEEDLKNQLHAALGRLALAGLDSPQRFRLKQSVIHQKMQDEKLFKLAWELGWLNLVDRDAQTDEPVYAFFYPTFQEYFAALAIDDWDYFLPCDHDNINPKPLRNRKYRIFSLYWKEVYLLWLGQRQVKREAKGKFIKCLSNFKDGACDTYSLYAALLIALGSSEYELEEKLAEDLFDFLMRLSFGFFDVKSKQLEVRCYHLGISAQAKAALNNSNRIEYSKVLYKWLKYYFSCREEIRLSNDPFTHSTFSKFFLEIAFTLIKLRSDDQSEISGIIKEFVKEDVRFKQYISSDSSHQKNDSIATLDEIYKIYFLDMGQELDKETLKQMVCSDKSELIDSLSSMQKDLMNPGDYGRLWYFTQNMDYSEFYDAWHSPLPNGSEADSVGDEEL